MAGNWDRLWAGAPWPRAAQLSFKLGPPGLVTSPPQRISGLASNARRRLSQITSANPKPALPNPGLQPSQADHLDLTGNQVRAHLRQPSQIATTARGSSASGHCGLLLEARDRLIASLEAPEPAAVVAWALGSGRVPAGIGRLADGFGQSQDWLRAHCPEKAVWKELWRWQLGCRTYQAKLEAYAGGLHGRLLRECGLVSQPLQGPACQAGPGRIDIGFTAMALSQALQPARYGRVRFGLDIGSHQLVGWGILKAESTSMGAWIIAEGPLESVLAAKLFWQVELGWLSADPDLHKLKRAFQKLTEKASPLRDALSAISADDLLRGRCGACD